MERFRLAIAVLAGAALVNFSSGCGGQEEDSSVILMENRRHVGSDG